MAMTGMLMDEVVPGLTWMDLTAILLSSLCQFISGQRFYQVTALLHLCPSSRDYRKRIEAYKREP
jgi:hypothetical protein